jgi:regulator of sirC expression with transglutaminase-like and TPR domain
MVDKKLKHMYRGELFAAVYKGINVNPNYFILRFMGEREKKSVMEKQGKLGHELVQLFKNCNDDLISKVSAAMCDLAITSGDIETFLSTFFKEKRFSLERGSPVKNSGLFSDPVLLERLKHPKEGSPYV